MAFGEQTLLAQHHEDILETNVVAPPTAALSKKAAVKESQEPRPPQSNQSQSRRKQGSPKPHAPLHISSIAPLPQCSLLNNDPFIQMQCPIPRSNRISLFLILHRLLQGHPTKTTLEYNLVDFLLDTMPHLEPRRCHIV
mmetsp:Transcript_36331/g.65413  ORF Transcript_36331/g.65413 Transcript_36331/m.65413 type:complete len:139 (+) Transcript_36331:142-558(+)